MLLNGSSCVTLTCASDDPTLELARRELETFLARRLEAQPATAPEIDVRLTVDAALPGYRVTAQGSRLDFAGRSPVEVLYSVYHFAEEALGYCFYEPGVDRLASEARGPVTLADGVVLERSRPLLENRGFIQEFPPSQDSYRLADWMARNRLNYLMTWMKYYDLFTDSQKQYFRVRGIRIEAGHHNFDYYIPLAKYYREHPEYFAIRNGQRVQPEAGDTAFLNSKQLCATHPGVRAEIVRNMAAYVQKHPEVDTLSLIPNDGFGWCECPECRKFYHPQKTGDFHTIASHVPEAQALYHNLVQEVAGRLEQVKPDVRLTLAAYVNYVDPAPGFALEPNMAVHLAPYWRCINHRLDDPACPTNRRYAQSIQRWAAAKRGGKINLYEYYMGVNLYVSLPMVHHEAIFGELQAAANLGVDGVLTQFHLTHWAAYGLNYYLMAKAAYGEGPQAVRQAMVALFGTDAQEAMQFYAAVRRLQESAGPCHIPVPRFLFHRTSIESYREIAAMAQQLLAHRPEDRLRQSLAAWTEYLLRFKDLFDRHQAGQDVRTQIDAFVQWAEQMTGSLNVCVIDKLRMLTGAWKRAIDAGRPWWHFNIDWEDAYIREYEQRWGESQKSEV